MRAAFLSSRNDCLANVAMLASSAITGYTHSAWPDLVVGLGIIALNAGAAFEVYQMARKEGQAQI